MMLACCSEQNPAILDAEAPGNIEASIDIVGPDSVLLSWTEPSDQDYIGVLIIRREDRYPEQPRDGVLIANVKKGTQTYLDFTAPLTPSLPSLFYSLYSYDTHNNTASGSQVGVHCSNLGCIGVPDLDSLNRIQGVSTAATVRSSVLEYLWGQADLPSRLPESIVSITDDDYGDIPDLLSIERITVDMDGGINSIAYLFHPLIPRNRLVIYHQGHAGSFIHGKDTIARFLAEGYAVLAFSMPLLGMNNALNGPTEHGDLAGIERAVRFFLEPIAVAVNYVTTTYFIEDVSMIGISGGGWTTVIYAALDPRISSSYPVASSYPFYVRNQTVGSVGDWEQSAPDFYAHASYIEFYILATFGRRQLQVFNLDDSCCFPGTYSETYREYIQEVAADMGGSFDVLIDATHQAHIISNFALNFIVADLER